MTNGELAKELSQYPLTAIAIGLLDFEQLKKASLIPKKKLKEQIH